MTNRNCRRKVVAETESITYGTHNSATKRNVDTNKVAEFMLSQRISSYIAGRKGVKGTNETEAQDLFSDGLVKLGEGDSIQKYKDTLDLDSGEWEDDESDEDEDVEGGESDYQNINDRVTGMVSEDEDELQWM
jgi:hypothetical protein